MFSDSYKIFLQAKELINKDDYERAGELLEQIYSLEPNDRIIKFEYARVLLHDKSTESEGVRLLNQLLSTRSRLYAMLELGKFEARNINISKAEIWFHKLLKVQNRNYAILELGKLEKCEGNYVQARDCFEQMLNLGSPQNREFALQELAMLNDKKQVDLKFEC